MRNRESLNEEIFAQAFKKFIMSTSEWSDCLVLTEVDTGEGIPDLIMVRINGKTRKEVVNTLSNLPAEPLLNGSGAILSELQMRPHTLKYLVRKTGLSPDYTKRAMNFLCKVGLATRTKNGSFIKSETHAIPDFKIIAFELKLRNINRALQQAIRYRQFAHKSTVVLPFERAKSVSNVANLTLRSSLGSATFDATRRRLRFYVQPLQTKPRSKHKYMHVVGKIIKHIQLGGDQNSQRRFPQQSRTY